MFIFRGWEGKASAPTIAPHCTRVGDLPKLLMEGIVVWPAMNVNPLLPQLKPHTQANRQSHCGRSTPCGKETEQGVFCILYDFNCPPVSSKWNVQSVLLLHGKAIYQWTHHKVVQKFGSLPVWQAGANQQPSCSILPPGFTPK